MTRRRGALSVVAVLLLSGCGTTVVTGSGAATGAAGAPGISGDGLTGEPPGLDGPGAVALPGTTTTTGTTAAPGDSVDDPRTEPAAAAPGAPGVSGAAAPVQRVTTPLEVGITYIDNSQSTAALGARDTRTVNARNVSEAYVRAINAAGGLQGRRLEPVWFQFNGQSADYSTQASAACARFTEDAKVSLVLDNAFGATGGFRACLQKAGVMSITTQSEGDRVSSREAALHVGPASMTVDRQYAAVLQQLAGAGYLGKDQQLGVILEDCPDIRRAWDRSLAPLVKALDLKAPVVQQLDCAVGFGSAGNAGSAVSSAILAFRQAGVDRVMLVSHFEDVLLLLFGPSAESQGYRPGYLLSSGAQAHALRTQVPEGQWPQFHGVGNRPHGDTDDAKPSGVDNRCLQLMKAAGLVPAGHDDKGTVLFLCPPYLMLDELLKRSGGVSDARTLMAVANGLGSSFSSPGTVEHRTLLSAERHDGADAVRVFAYVEACECLRYTAPAVRAPQ